MNSNVGATTEDDRVKEFNANMIDFSSQESLGKCPKCAARIFEHGDAYICEKSIGDEISCDFRSGKVILEQPVDSVQMKKLLTDGNTDLLDHFVTKRTGKKFSAYLVLNEGLVCFDFSSSPPKKRAIATATDLSKPLKAASQNAQDSGSSPDKADIDALLDESNSNTPSRMRKLFHKHFNAHMEQVCGVVNHPRCPPDLMEHIARYGISEKNDFRFAVLGGHKFPPIDVISILIDDTEETRNKILQSLSNHFNSSAKIVKKLQQSCHEILRICAISNDCYTSVRLLRNAASDEAASVRLACAEASICPSRILDQLAQDRDPDVRAAAVANPNLKRSFILKHYKDEKDLKVRLSYLQREDCPAKVIKYYFVESDERLKKTIATHQHCPADILRILTTDHSDQVRLNVALNENTPSASIKALTMDSFPAVRSAAGFHANCTEDRFQYGFKIPDVTYPPDSDNAELLAKIQSIKDCYSKCILENEELVEDLIDRFLKVKNISLAWNFEYFLAPPDYVDRTRGMLAGPLYTSQKYPWPTNKMGLPAEPIMQIDLDEVRHICGESYGTGLLQVYVDHIELITRNIPRSDIHSGELIKCEYDFFAPLGEDGHWFYEYLESPNHQIAIHQIVGYKAPYISSEVIPFEHDDDSHPPELRKLNNLLKEVCDAGEGNHLFGDYDQIQSQRCMGDLLVALEGCDGFVWGDMGNAQVFVEKSNDGCRYSAQWSCS